MQPIRLPEVIEPDRVMDNDRGELAADHEARANALDDALHESCSYAQQLWNTLNAARHYLYDSLPSSPHSPGPRPNLGARPTGPDDEDGWNTWITAYAAINSTLCGPHGDSGYGLSEARHAAQERRTAPNLLLFAHHPNLLTHPTDAAAATAPRAEPPDHREEAAPPASRTARAVTTSLLIVLAVRGLLPRRRSTS